MRDAKLGPLTVKICGGIDREGGGDGPVVVLLHGFGAPGTDLVPLWRALDVPHEVRWVFPSAPLDLAAIGYGMDARAWWMIDMAAIEAAVMTGRMRDLTDELPVGMPEARAVVLELLDAVDRELSPSALVLGGFSQGAMLAMDTALHTDRALAGLVLWSGTLLSQSVWKARMPARKGLKVVQSHGSSDPLLPFSIAEQLRALMTESGLEVTWVPFRGGHEIPAKVLDATAALIRGVV